MDKNNQTENLLNDNKQQVLSENLEWVERSSKKIMYNVDGIGNVVEEIKIAAKRRPEENASPKYEATLNVYINNELAKQENLITAEVIKSNPKYEPFNFLRGIVNEQVINVEGSPYVPFITLFKEVMKESKKNQ